MQTLIDTITNLYKSHLRSLTKHTNTIVTFVSFTGTELEYYSNNRRTQLHLNFFSLGRNCTISHYRRDATVYQPLNGLASKLKFSQVESARVKGWLGQWLRGPNGMSTTLTPNSTVQRQILLLWLT